MIVHKWEEHIAKGIRVHYKLQCIKEGDESSKFYFDFLKKKIVANRVLSLCRVGGSLDEDPSKVNMSDLHFHNIFSYALTNQMLDARNYCHRINPHKVSIRDWGRLDNDFSKEELFATLNSMQNGKSPSFDKLPCEFCKAMWDIVEEDFCS
jgi:hypothetical protein